MYIQECIYQIKSSFFFILHSCIYNHFVNFLVIFFLIRSHFYLKFCVHCYLYFIGKLEKNDNAEAVTRAVQEQREQSKQEYEKKKEKDKQDREQQKQKEKDRKETEKKRTQKGERRR